MIGIIGRSGAGKSTLLRIINRLTDATDGEVEIDGQNILQLKSKEKRILAEKLCNDFSNNLT